MHLISQEARDEWTALQGAWWSDSRIREGVVVHTEEQLEELEKKVRRFRDIVRGLAPKRCEISPVRSVVDEQQPASIGLSARGVPSAPELFARPSLRETICQAAGLELKMPSVGA